MTHAVVKIAKEHRPLTIAAVKRELQRTYPQYEYLMPDPPCRELTVKGSRFCGARICLQDNLITLRGKAPDALARVIDACLIGLLSSAASPDLVRRLQRCLRERFEH